jgi:hypothetical protein
MCIVIPHLTGTIIVFLYHTCIEIKFCVVGGLVGMGIILLQNNNVCDISCKFLYDSKQR